MQVEAFARARGQPSRVGGSGRRGEPGGRGGPGGAVQVRARVRTPTQTGNNYLLLKSSRSKLVYPTFLHLTYPTIDVLKKVFV